MSEYRENAEKFLKDCNATMEIKFLYKGVNELWDDNQARNIYSVTITTPRGNYNFKFYDSIHNTEIIDKFNKFNKSYGLDGYMKLKREAENAKPNAYDVLACLYLCEPSSFEDFCWEFGLSTDSIKALKTYLEVQKENDGLRKIFTKEQLEQLMEIV